MTHLPYFLNPRFWIASNHYFDSQSSGQFSNLKFWSESTSPFPFMCVLFCFVLFVFCSVPIPPLRLRLRVLLPFLPMGGWCYIGMSFFFFFLLLIFRSMPFVSVLLPILLPTRSFVHSFVSRTLSAKPVFFSIDFLFFWGEFIPTSSTHLIICPKPKKQTHRLAIQTRFIYAIAEY